MESLEELRAREAELRKKLKEVELQVQAECDGLDMSKYTERLRELGLYDEWSQVQAAIGALSPRREKSETERRRDAGLTYVKHNWRIER